MSKFKARWINLDSSTLQANGDDVQVKLDNGTLSAGAGGIQIVSVSGDVIAAGTIADAAFVSPLLKANGTFTDGTTVFTAGIDLNGNAISGLADPVNDQDAATKAYVDAIAAGLDPKASVRVATVSADIAATYAAGGGAGGTGQFTSAPATIDGITVAEGDRILVKDQTDAKQNGIYVVTSTTTTWDRSSDMDGSPANEVSVGNFTFTEAGTVNSGKGFVLLKDGANDGTLTLNTHNLNWTQFSAAGLIEAGDALSKSGETLNVNVDSTTIQINGSDQLELTNNDLTVSAGLGLTGGGLVALGGSTTINVDAAELVSGGDAQIDGDLLHIDFTPSTYTDPSEDTLSAHLNSIDTFLGTVGSGNGNVSAAGNFTDNRVVKAIGGTTNVEETTLIIDDSNNLIAPAAVDVGGALSAVGAATLDSTLYVGGAATFASTISGAGAVEFDSTLSVDGNITAAADVLVSGNVVVDGQAYSIEYDGGTVTGATAIDWNNGNVQHFTLSGDTTFTESNAQGGGTYILIVEQDATGGRAITAPSGFTFPGGVTPDYSTAANEVNVIATVYSAVDSTHYADIRNDEPLNAQDLANLPTEITEGLTLATAGAGELSAVLSQTPISTSNVKLWPDGGPFQINQELGGGDFGVAGTTVTCQTTAGFLNGDDIYVSYEYYA